MAQRTTVLLTDDLDGTEAVETVEFAIDGRQFEIDLNAEHAADIREMLELYVDAARQVGGAIVAALHAPLVSPRLPPTPRRSARGRRRRVTR